MLILLQAAPQETAAGPLPPREALASFRLPEGFRIELVAAEPDVMDPVAMAFDADGRIYVAEMADYPLGPPSGRIRLLEDRDGDGRVDRSTILAAGIPYPTGVMPWRGGVLVTAAPDILFLKDADGDGKAEIREVIFTGFKEGNQQHRVNGLLFGMDNWIHGTNGDSGGEIRRPDGKAVSISGRDFRFKADYSGFEPQAGHGQYANAFDSWGRRFINDNSNHLRHPVLPLKYLGRNPHLAVPSVEEGISDHGPASRVFAASRLQARPNDHFAANHFTSACSVTIYRSPAFGPEFEENAFVCEPVHNLVHRDLIVPNGASLTAKAAYADREFLASTDNWSRPVNLCVGPEGALYVVDMYRAVIEHPQWIPLEMQKRIDLRAGHDRGRIYRVVRDGMPPAARPRLSSASTSERVAHLDSDQAWWRLTAQRLLIEAGDRSAVPALERLLAAEKATTRLHALHTLEGLGALSDAAVAEALKDGHPGIREQALRLAEPRLAVPALREGVLERAGDADARVRFQAALTMGALRPEPRLLEKLAGILERDASDKWTRLAALSSLNGDCPELFRILAGRGVFARPGGDALLNSLAGIVGASREEKQIVPWLRVLAEGVESTPARWRLAALAALGPSLRKGRLPLDEFLRKAGVSAVVESWRSGFLETVRDAARDLNERVAALELLTLIPPDNAGSLFSGLLHPREPQEIQAAAVRALGSLGDETLLAGLLGGWPSYTALVRREVLSACFSRPALIEKVLERLEKGELRPGELDAQHREGLLKHPSGGVRERSRSALKGKGGAELEALIESQFAKVSALTADPLAGEKVFFQNCATCHRLHGQGFNVGPNLQSVMGRDKKSLLTDLLNPNAALAPQYQVYIVKTPTQDLVSGIIVADTPAGLTLRRANAEETTVLRKDILELKAWPASMMPEGLENSLSPQNFADLLEFLRRGVQR